MHVDIPKGDNKHSKADLEALVHKHGGEYTQQQLSDFSAYVISPDVKSESVCYSTGETYNLPRSSGQISGQERCFRDEARLAFRVYQAETSDPIDQGVSVSHGGWH